MKLLRREGVDLRVSEMLYWELVQAVLLWGEETWVLLEAMSRNMEVGGTAQYFSIFGKNPISKTSKSDQLSLTSDGS